jgi:hypothetical protein
LSTAVKGWSDVGFGPTADGIDSQAMSKATAAQAPTMSQFSIRAIY